ncbi:hypothetical protein [Roseofilum capinflatum]|uniref:Type II toxin-antitoxin system VapC family toxin n=1 Tax=Roseofilum capinflatum BLCC-M114 TaxID=3022440 RepID=A0ABT7B571_9CYAN|nr:hypothetical protein [Roseofilum capinflatum]MDJ1174327.1 hypothetical protein [Roseofilum capinflatum BLCC-M114]
MAAPHPPTPFSHRRRGKVPLPWERDLGRGLFLFHNSNGLAIYLIDETTANIYSHLKASIFRHFAPKEKAKRRGANIYNLGFTDHDLWIVSTALQHSLTLVSADNDMKRIQEVQQFSLESWR